LQVIPLQEEQVIEANLQSKQGGINFTTFVLSCIFCAKINLFSRALSRQNLDFFALEKTRLDSGNKK